MRFFFLSNLNGFASFDSSLPPFLSTVFGFTEYFMSVWMLFQHRFPRFLILTLLWDYTDLQYCWKPIIFYYFSFKLDFPRFWTEFSPFLFFYSYLCIFQSFVYRTVLYLWVPACTCIISHCNNVNTMYGLKHLVCISLRTLLQDINYQIIFEANNCYSDKV